MTRLIKKATNSERAIDGNRMIERWGLIPLLIQQGFVGIGVWLLGEIQPGNVVWPAEAFGHEDRKSKWK
jgi:hypothetical protein